MAAGVWDGIDKERVAKAMVTAYLSDEYLEALAAINNAETLAELAAAREQIKDLMALWREEAPEYAFVIDALYLFSEKIQVQLTGGQSRRACGVAQARRLDAGCRRGGLGRPPAPLQFCLHLQA
jgi:hypothetical protein